MYEIICPQCSSDQVEDISTLSSKKIQELEKKLNKTIIKQEEIDKEAEEKETDMKVVILFIYFVIIISLFLFKIIESTYTHKIYCSCCSFVILSLLIPHFFMKIKFTPKKYKKQYICNYCGNIFEIQSKKNITCSKCECETIYKVSTLIENIEEKDDWNSIDEEKSIDEKAKSKMLFLESLYKKKIYDIIKSSFLYIYIAFIIPLILYLPLGLVKLFDVNNTINISPEMFMPSIVQSIFEPNLKVSSNFLSLNGVSIFDCLYLFIVTVTFYIVILFDYNIYLIRKKKFNSYYFCSDCQDVFVPIKNKVKLKKNTSLFTKLYLAHKKLTRKKFVNARYVGDRATKKKK